MNLILFKRSEISADGTSIRLQDKDPRTKHIFGHLRKTDGDSVTIGIISGGRGKAIVRTGDGEGSRLELVLDCSDYRWTSLKDSGSSHRHEIVLVLSLPFPKRLKGLWAQITSMGVTRICVIRGTLSDPNYCKSSVITPQVYRPLVEEGMSQGCHTQEVAVDVTVDEVVSRGVLEKLGLVAAAPAASAKTGWSSSSCDDVRIFLDCGDETTEPLPARQVITNQLSEHAPADTYTPKRIVVAIGSERGWTDDEAKLFHDAGYESASLGRSVLRVDTAVIAGLGIVSSTLDEIEVLQQEEETRDGNQTESHSRKRKQDRKE
eukprot:jgi/Psemu1/186793/e_gw1.61.94.1